MFRIQGCLTAALPVLLTAMTAGHVGDAGAATLQVTTCDDTGAGSVRDAVARAVSGDTIDMRALGCNRISLGHGPITILQNDLTLLGPNRAVALHGRDATQVVRHLGIGSLRIMGLSIAHGFVAGDQALGGCIYSEGSVELRNSQVHHCVAFGVGVDNFAGGGGVYVQHDLSLLTSSVYDNIAKSDGNTGLLPFGGGVLAFGRLTAINSDISYNASQGTGGGAMATGVTVRFTTIRGNEARNAGGISLVGAGLPPYPDSTVANSTIAGNHASNDFGGAFLFQGKVLVLNSTISGNVADDEVGGAFLYSGSAGVEVPVVRNSTIAFNRQSSGSPECGALYWPGGSIELESTIVANNLCADRRADIEVAALLAPKIVGSHNLIGESTVAVPPDTISAAPRLGVLADNGGPTRTHDLLPNSPAIDAGDNVRGLRYDQRGPGFPRVKGSQADIGAFER